uniref:Uncharacterized protein n=1 Tax=Coccidioides posadasii RMSCC 3488 TaxID=454284 RepID=A0A0J6FEI8_COCPO|nr:hypothetical protein CPAG_05057 [Coccidioides posadasii RMSCC 3488]
MVAGGELLGHAWVKVMPGMHDMNMTQKGPKSFVKSQRSFFKERRSDSAVSPGPLCPDSHDCASKEITFSDSGKITEAVLARSRHARNSGALLSEVCFSAGDKAGDPVAIVILQVMPEGVMKFI